MNIGGLLFCLLLPTGASNKANNEVEILKKFPMQVFTTPIVQGVCTICRFHPDFHTYQPSCQWIRIDLVNRPAVSLTENLVTQALCISLN